MARLVVQLIASIAMRGVIAAVALSVCGCSLVTAVPDDSARSGSGGDAPTSGGGPATTNTGAGGVGGMEGCASGVLGDADNCGQCGWSCGPGSACDGDVCEPTIIALDDSVANGVAVLDDASVAVQLGFPTKKLEVRAIDFVDPSPLGVVDLAVMSPDLEAGVGLLGRGLPLGGGFVYAPQTSSGLGAGPVPVLSCSSLLDCQIIELLGAPDRSNAHINGMAAVDDQLVVLFNLPTPRLYAAPLSCLTTGSCTVAALSPPVMSTTLQALLLDVRTSDGSLWWTTFGNTTQGCLYRWTPGDVPVSEVPCALGVDQLFGVTVGGDLVIVGSGFGGDGPLHWVDTTANLSATPLPDGLRWPADADAEDLLFAYDTVLGALVALRASEGGVLMEGQAPLVPGQALVSIDASHSDFVFALSNGGSGSHLYRWRKPAPGR